MSNKKVFTAEYKKEIIRLITETGKKVSDVAKDIWVTETSVRRWLKQYGEHGEDAFPGKGKLRPEDKVDFNQIIHYNSFNFLSNVCIWYGIIIAVIWYVAVCVNFTFNRVW